MTVVEYKKRFLEEYGYNLEDSSVLPDVGNFTQSKKVERFFMRVNAIIEMHITKFNSNYNESKITDKQKEALDNAILEQSYYMLTAGDVTVMTGFDPVTNNIVDLDALRRRTIAPLAEQYLLKSGLLYRGIRTKIITKVDGGLL